MAEIQTTGGSLGSTLSGVANLAQLFLGNSQSTTGTQTVTDNRTQTTSTSGGTNTTTTSTSVPAGAVDAVVKSILEGTNGLAAIAGGQRTAGLYGSSTNQLLSNDLIARAAAEGAKLSQTTTQTATTAPTTTTTSLSGGTTTGTNQTTSKAAAINPKLAVGALGLLQAIPKGVKDSVIAGILGTKGAGATAASAGESASSSQQAIADAYSDPSRALDVAGGSSVGADGVASVGGVSGTNAPQIDGISLGIGAGDVDVGGAFETDGLSNFLSSNDNFAGVDVGTDYLNELGSGIGDALGGFASGIGDAATNVADSIGSFFDDFSFSFADGGHVSKEAKDSQLASHFSKKIEEFYSKKSLPAYKDGGRVTDAPIKREMPHYANGGKVATSDTYDLDTRDVSYLANTGLRAGNLRSVSTGSASSNDQFISQMLSEQLRGREANGVPTAIYNPGTRTAGASAQTDAAGANSSVSQPTVAGNGSAVGAGTTDGPVGNVGGLSGLGISSNQANAIGSAVSAVSGIGGLGTVAGMATSNNVAQSFAQTVATAAATAAGGPVAGAIVAGLFGLMGNVNAGNSGGANGGIGGSSQGEVGNTTASVSVGEATADDGTVAVGAPVGTTSETIGDNSGGGDGAGGGVGSAGGPGSGSDGGAGDSGVGGDSAGDGTSGSAGTSAGGDAWANGGEIDGPGTGVSDSILAKVSDGEYIIPADVVEALGVPFFDKLRDKYHTPTTKQKKG